VNTKAALVTTAACAADVALVGWILLRGRAPVGGRRVLQAAIAGAVFLGAQLAVAVGLQQRFFLGVSLVWGFCAIALPVCALLVLLAGRRRALGAAARGLAWASLATVPLVLYASFVEPYRLVTERADVPIVAARALPRPITVGVLADVQLVEVSEREREAVRRVMDARPDLILIPGDLAQVGSDNVPALAAAYRELLAPLDAPLGVFCVHGDCETKNDARTLIAGTRVRFLDDEVVAIERDGLRVTLAGISLRTYTDTARAALRALETRPGDELRVVLAHRPDVLYELPAPTRVDLVVSGHTHGGQVQLPLVGPPLVLSRVPRSVGAGGLHEVDGRRVYVSRGIGWEHGHAPRLRFLCPPEVSLLKLTPAARPGP
jgi:hypothetical protein